MPPRQNYAFLAAYDGRPYLGFQPQGALPTVGGTINSALRRLEIGASIFGASRTDARVQSFGQVISFQSRADIFPEKIEAELRDLLPGTIRVRALQRVPASFHAHWSSAGKTYRYRISPRIIAGSRDEGKSTAADFHSIDPCLFRHGLEILASLDDLSAFSASDARDGGKIRTILPPRILEESPENGILVEIRGRGFGRYQIRNLIAAAIAFGSGRLGEAGILAAARRESPHPFRAPAEGLCLFRVHYPPGSDPFETDFGSSLSGAARAIPFLENYLTKRECLDGIPETDPDFPKVFQFDY